MTTNLHYCLLLPHLGSYHLYNSTMGDQLDGPFNSKVEAWLAARDLLTKAGHDPSAVLDMTTASEAELGE